jgi:hypothetical protein
MRAAQKLLGASNIGIHPQAAQNVPKRRKKNGFLHFLPYKSPQTPFFA